MTLDDKSWAIKANDALWLQEQMGQALVATIAPLFGKPQEEDETF